MDSSRKLVEQLAEGIVGRGLALPAMLLLEVTKPFSFLASQGLFLCQPLVGLVNQDFPVGDYAALLSDRSNIEYLIAHLERVRIEGKEES